MKNGNRKPEFCNSGFDFGLFADAKQVAQGVKTRSGLFVKLLAVLEIADGIADGIAGFLVDLFIDVEIDVFVLCNGDQCAGNGFRGQ